MKPHKQHIIVKPLKSESISRGGIIVPDSVQERSNKGLIVAVGEGTKEKPMKLKVGYITHNIQGCGTPIEENGELFFIMRQQDVLAVEN